MGLSSHLILSLLSSSATIHLFYSNIPFSPLTFHYSAFLFSLRHVLSNSRHSSPPPVHSIYLVLSCLVLSYLVLSCLVLSCLVLSCLVLPCLVLSCFFCLKLICLVLSCLVLSCFFFVLNWFVLSSLANTVNTRRGSGHWRRARESTSGPGGCCVAP